MTTDSKTKCVLYARFSPRPGAATCESCESQIADLRQYAWKRGYEIVGEYSDKALSGGDDWTARAGMFDAAHACKRGTILVVRAFDRLFRDTEKALVFKSMLEAKGCKIRSITEEIACDGSPIGDMMRTIFLAIAEYQRAMGKARTKAKMLQHQAGGRRMSQRPPYGTMADPLQPKLLIPCPPEQEVIRYIKKFHARGLNFRQIARELEARGIERRGKKTWSHQLVKTVLVRQGVVSLQSERIP